MRWRTEPGPAGEASQRSGRGIGPALPALVLLALLLALRVFDPVLLQAARLDAFDMYQRVAPRPYQPVAVRVVEIDDESLARLGQWPWPRDRLAALIERLAEMGAATVVLDLVLAEPDRLAPARIAEILAIHPELAGLEIPLADLPDPDGRLADSFRRVPVVTGFALTREAGGTEPEVMVGFAEIGPVRERLERFTGAVATLPLFERAARGDGSLSVGGTGNEIIRRLPLVALLGDGLVPSLTVEALRVPQGENTVVLRAPPETGRLEQVRIGGFTVPVEADGQMWIHYTAPEPTRAVPAWRLLGQPEDDPGFAAAIAGHIVLVGTTATGFGDARATPLRSFEPGVMIQAQALEQMVLGWHLERPGWADGAEVVLLVVLGLALIALAQRLRAAACAMVTLALVAAILLGSWLAFAEARLLLDPVLPAGGLIAVYLAASVAVQLRSERDRARIRRAFSHYLSPAMVQQLVERPERLRLGGEMREMSIVFTDIAGFTALTLEVEPERLVALLNGYLDAACRIVLEHGGTIDKIVGDALHVMFNAPLDQPDHATRAVRCALAIDAFARRFEAARAAEEIAFGSTRIGVDSGPAVVGNFGGRDRFDYTAYGDVVNLASRLEQANKRLGTRICVSRAAAERCPDMTFRPIARLSLRGRAEPVETFEPVAPGVADPARLARYAEAYALLIARDPGAAAAFAALAREWPDDPLVRLHAERLAAGARGADIGVA